MITSKTVTKLLRPTLEQILRMLSFTQNNGETNKKLAYYHLFLYRLFSLAKDNIKQKFATLIHYILKIKKWFEFISDSLSDIASSFNYFLCFQVEAVFVLLGTNLDNITDALATQPWFQSLNSFCAIFSMITTSIVAICATITLIKNIYKGADSLKIQKNLYEATATTVFALFSLVSMLAVFGAIPCSPVFGVLLMSVDVINLLVMEKWFFEPTIECANIAFSGAKSLITGNSSALTITIQKIFKPIVDSAEENGLSFQKDGQKYLRFCIYKIADNILIKNPLLTPKILFTLISVTILTTCLIIALFNPALAPTILFWGGLAIGICQVTSLAYNLLTDSPAKPKISPPNSFSAILRKLIVGDERKSSCLVTVKQIDPQVNKNNIELIEQSAKDLEPTAVRLSI